MNNDILNIYFPSNEFTGNNDLVLFVNKCNFNCNKCRYIKENIVSVINIKEKIILPEETINEIIDFIKNNKNYIDNIIITGGEPFIIKNIDELIDKIVKSISKDKKVIIYTNGYNTKFDLLKKYDNLYYVIDVKDTKNDLSNINNKVNKKLLLIYNLYKDNKKITFRISDKLKDKIKLNFKNTEYYKEV